MDKELTTICEFITFCHQVCKSDKGIKNLSRLVTPSDMTPEHVVQVKQAFSTYFSGITQWTGFTGSIIYKTGMVNIGAVEKKCAKNAGDATAFAEYMQLFQALYADMRRNLIDFISKLNLEQGSPEALFMANLFNEIGGDIMDTIKSGGGTKDIASLLPKVFEMVKSGKILQVMEKLKDGTIKISKILKAFTMLVEEYENETTMKLTNGENAQVVTTVVDDDSDEKEKSD